MDKITEIERIIFTIKKEVDFFEEKFKELINQENFFLKDEIFRFLFSNSKRLRPIFTIIFSKILDIKNEDVVLKIALAQEIIHNASLLHDDIIDSETTRRDIQTINSKFNSKTAVLAGDFLLSLALRVLSKTSIKTIEIFSLKIKNTILAELEQNASSYKITGEEIYFKKTFEKTGSLFFAGLESLFEYAEHNEETKENLFGFLKNYTLAFQIKNDIDDIESGNLSDIKNGNYTLPVIYFCMENELYELNKENIKKYTVLSHKKAAEFLEKALSYLKKYNSQYTNMLVNLSKYTLGSKN